MTRIDNDEFAILEKLDYRLKYITNLFKKIQHKKYESYVIARLWHLLSNPEIKFVPQQYVKRNNNQYALTDLYLPQVSLHIEINEPAHYSNQEIEERDSIRNTEIQDKTNHLVKVISFQKNKYEFKSLFEINKEIDDLANFVKNLIDKSKQNRTFKPWGNEDEFTALHFIKKGSLHLNDEPSLKTIEEVCALFAAEVPYRGYLRKGGTPHPKYSNYFIWWPIEKNRSWNNKISINNDTIYESHNNMEKRIKHVNDTIKHNHKRIVFYRNTDVLGFTFYRFKGVFELNLDLTSTESGLVWKRISEEFVL